MTEEKKIKQAQIAYDTLCAMLTDKDWEFQKDDKNLSIHCTAHGDDLPIEVDFRVNAERSIVTLLSVLPFTVPEEKRADMALAVTIANWPMVDGGFDYNFLNGRVIFRLTTSFMESLLSKEMFEYMLLVSCSTVDHYNDKFFMMAKDRMTLQEFIQSIKE